MNIMERQVQDDQADQADIQALHRQLFRGQLYYPGCFLEQYDDLYLFYLLGCTKNQEEWEIEPTRLYPVMHYDVSRSST
jgi:hypothetical protein